MAEENDIEFIKHIISIHNEDIEIVHRNEVFNRTDHHGHLGEPADTVNLNQGCLRYRRVEGSECGLRSFSSFCAYIILVSRETSIITQLEILELWSLEVSRVWHSFSAFSESRL